MSTEKKNPKLDTIRALLARAEDPSTTEAEAELARKRAFEMMAKYGVEEAMLSDGEPSRDAISDRYVDLPNPWSMSRVRLMGFIAKSVGCEAVSVRPKGAGGARRLHIVGYESDIQRAEVLYASLVLQMFSGLAAQTVPWDVSNARAWRNSWQLGFIERVIERIKATEQAARTAAEGETSVTGRSGALVLADRAAVVQAAYKKAHPRIRTSRGSYSGSGYGDGAAAGSRADIGGTRRIGAATAGALAA
ncbi:hypothetical protein C9F11_20920 [Streptomyces sp. YIM 121038]|uniref:DUF2786 domain-containing protein n=1 Tax=Streptomyces sp. YIM 121038 TaxID=2136401 RepID=UPI0011109233|nr:DUF2786 domain-containing protein [Streptomyces sp. YIM 121038]QCX77816.1 hypothetical protein C9F11_20920 [Streptomyces sp. YIM 121038]